MLIHRRRRCAVTGYNSRLDRPCEPPHVVVRHALAGLIAAALETRRHAQLGGGDGAGDVANDDEPAALLLIEPAGQQIDLLVENLVRMRLRPATSGARTMVDSGEDIGSSSPCWCSVVAL